ncbi:TetR family transcriptional regulator [Streptomyces sp. NPDC057623]|uniref:TetR family transcriptional regulator n=1 Tax=Streptomyces sp. NPDC057623 TaxID=3346187 RepID=UPI003697436A
MAWTSGGPRARRSREAALAAAIELLVEGGPELVTHAAVAERAGVGRATVYRD